MEIKKVLYHGGFATLGVSLLLGMAILQANGRKAPDDLLTADETAAPASDTATTDVASAAMTPAEPIQSVVPPVKVASPMLAKVRESVNPVSLENVHSFSIFDSADKAGTKKTFSIAPNSLRAAKAYYEQLSASPTVVIKAETHPGKFETISAGVFTQYIASTLGE